MLKFKIPELSDKPWIDECLTYAKGMNCEYTFGNLYIWNTTHATKVCKYKDFFICRWNKDGEYLYSVPIGTGDFADAIHTMMEDAKSLDTPFKIYGVTDYYKQLLEESFPNQFSYEYNEDFNDYIYDIEKMTTLAGRKYHGKRNHITNFKKNNPDWKFEEITKENLTECIKVHNQWIYEHTGGEDTNQELDAALLAFQDFEELGLVGGLIRVDGEVIAYTLGEAMNKDVFVTHFEKASHYTHGIYPLINQEFTIHCLQGYKYVNREEDLGLPGLRKSKRSYYPEIFLEKGIASYGQTSNES